MQLQAMAELAATYVNTTHRHIFLTGKAGTGKTTFLKYIMAHTHKHTVVAAPTGIAAINAGGVTLHSLLQLPFGSFIPEAVPLSPSESKITTPQTLFKNSRFNANKREVLREIELLIIDEVSMLRADLLDCIDHTLRHIRRNALPFGGVQILFIGDLMQLPPVVKDDERNLLTAFYPSLYFFEAKALKGAPPIHVELQKIFRQQDEEFISLLNRLRHNKQTSKDVEFLNSYFNPDFDQAEESGYIHLTTHNYRADKLNQQKLGALEAELHSFHAHIEGTFPDSMFPTAPELHLKEGAQVMFIKNDPSGEGQYFNGKIGVVSGLGEEEIWVKFEDGDEVLVTQYTWENKRYELDHESSEIEESLLGTFQHYPIKLAWAVTVHKSQGLTFEKAILDLSGTFAPGQLYVALSRLTSLEGLVLSSPLPADPPTIDASLSRFNTTAQQKEELEQSLKSDQKSFLFDMGKVVFDFTALIKDLTVYRDTFPKGTEEGVKSYKKWVSGVTEQLLPLQKVGEGFQREIHRTLHDEGYLEQLSGRMEKAKTYFLASLKPIAEELQNCPKELVEDKKTKKHLKEIDGIEDGVIKKIRDIERICFLLDSLLQDGMPNQFQPKAAMKLTQQKRSKKAKVADKEPTSEVTFRLFREGKTVKEIAKERGLVVGTIEGHLAQHIEKGDIQIEDLVEAKKISKIVEVLRSEAVGLNEIKSQLPKSYTYGEIKMVMAYEKSNQ